MDSQHVLLGCCTNLMAFCDDAGLAGKVRWYDRQTFLEPGGRASTIELSGLPAPLHYAGSFLKASMLGVADKLAIARGLMEFTHGYPRVDDENVLAVVSTNGSRRRARFGHFWEPIVLATLNDSAANCSMKYAGKVFYELFLKTSVGGKLGIPTVPLSEFYGAGTRLVEANGGKVELRSSVESIAAAGGWTMAAWGTVRRPASSRMM